MTVADEPSDCPADQSPRRCADTNEGVEATRPERRGTSPLALVRCVRNPDATAICIVPSQREANGRSRHELAAC
jgi:hypothetical protein